MLGIGKIRPGRETYHLDAVADGAEDYYFAPHETPGVWIGAGATSLGLRGQVARDQLVDLLAGKDPITGTALTARAAARSATRLPGYDVTLRAPKSVSLLWALTTDDQVRATIQVAHDDAVAATLVHLDNVAAETRRGLNGTVRMPTNGFIAAGFRHRTSRAGDPVLHTHLVIPNVVRGIDGRWSAPDGTLLYANAKSSGYVYQALLRGELTRRLGVAWGPVHNGTADILGVSPEVIRAFSRRRVEIESRRDAIAARAISPNAGDAGSPPTLVTHAQVAAERARAIRDSGTTGQLAALETRRRKDGSVDMRGAVTEWRERAARLSYDERARQGQVGMRSARSLDESSRAAVADRLVGELCDVSPSGTRPEVDLCARASTWSRRDALMGWCSQLRAGADSLDQLADLTDTFLHTHPAVLRAKGQPGLRPGDGIRLATGAFVAARSDLVRYTTRRMRAVEEELVAAAIGRVDDGVAIVPVETVALAVAEHSRDVGFPLTTGQEAMIFAVNTSGRGVDVVVGRAGSGKTTALAVARRAWQASGHQVHGAAKAAVAARHLELATGIPSQTLDSLLIDVRTERSPLSPGGVLVVDEAATTETPLLAELLVRARASRWKVVLVGDDQQLAEIDAGGGFRGLRQRLPACVLSENLRQHHAWERDAVDLVRRGIAVDALTAYVEHGRVVITDNREAAHRLMVARWWRRRGDGRSELLQAHRNADVRELNRLARERRVAAGELVGPVLRFGVEIGVGDHVMTRIASRTTGVVNGLRGEVVSIETTAGSEALIMRLDDGPTRRLAVDYLSRTSGDGLPALDLAYATTIHRNQGVTAERSQTLLDAGLTTDAAYVALSRGREANELVLVAARTHVSDDVSHWDDAASPRRALTECLRVFERSAAKHLSVDAGPDIAQASTRVIRGDQIDRLLTVWRRSRSTAIDPEASPTVATARDPIPPTSDPHLLAIEELLAAPRENLLDAVARYRSRLQALLPPMDEDDESGASNDGSRLQRRHAWDDAAARDADVPQEPDALIRGPGSSLRSPRLS